MKKIFRIFLDFTETAWNTVQSFIKKFVNIYCKLHKLFLKGPLAEINCRCLHEIERENVYSPVSLDGQNRTQIGWCMINQGAETLVKHVKDGKGCGFSSNIISRGLVSTNCSSCEHGRRRTQSRLHFLLPIEEVSSIN